jgi:hypothetical protein
VDVGDGADELVRNVRCSTAILENLRALIVGIILVSMLKRCSASGVEPLFLPVFIRPYATAKAELPSEVLKAVRRVASHFVTRTVQRNVVSKPVFTSF